MRRSCFAPVILLPLLLCACGGENTENDLVLDLRSDFQTMDTWAGQMDVTADYGQRVYEYTVSFTGSREEGTVLTILAPEEAAGITAEAKEGRTWLDYDGVRVVNDMKKEDAQAVKWQDVQAAFRRKDCVYLYVSPVRAYLLPSGQTDAGDDELWAYLREHLGVKCRE